MASIKCKMCGADLNVVSDESVVECEYCGSRQTIPAMDNQKKLTLFARANRLRIGCEFDKAAGIYEAIVTEFPTEAEAYWGLVLCKYGIEYVDDPATGKKIPTCHRSSFSSILEDSDFEQAQENADGIARKQYREEAKQIEELRKGIISVSTNEQPYDIFICYKETDESGNRTLDSVLAQDIYDALTSRGYRVFFSRISLEDKLGLPFEPYIFAALHSAKIMLAVGTDYEYFNAVWVKNEWSRYLKLMAQDREKHLIPCYKDIDAYDMPREFARLQAQDLGKLGAIQDLVRGVEKLLPRPSKSQETVVHEEASNSSKASTSPLLKRAFIFLEDGDWENADAYCEKILDADPENGEAYLGKLMVQMRIQRREMLSTQAEPFDENLLFQKAMRYGDASLKKELQEAIHSIRERMIQAEKEQEERKARIAAEEARSAKALQAFQAKYREKRIPAERARYEEIERYNDGVAAQIEQTKVQMETVKKQLAEQKQIYAANEKKIFGAGARAKKEALEQISRLNAEYDRILPQLLHPPFGKEVPYCPEETAEYAIDDFIRFGAYPQTRLGSHDAPIEWMVLTVEGNKALLLSRYGLDAQPYNTKDTDITWEECTLRAWLNEDFMSRAFTAEEQAAILLTNVDNSAQSVDVEDEDDYDDDEWASGGNQTQDKVFLLSYAEANRYLDVTSYNSRNTKSRVVPTAYAIAQGAWIAFNSDNKTGRWWLRSPGYTQSKAASVFSDGSLGANDVDKVDISVRPALWVKLDSE